MIWMYFSVFLSLEVFVLNLAADLTFAILRYMHLCLHFQRHSPSLPLRRHKNDDAVDIREQSAALVSFQWHQPSQPPADCANSVVSPVLAARHFSG